MWGGVGENKQCSRTAQQTPGDDWAQTPGSPGGCEVIRTLPQTMDVLANTCPDQVSGAGLVLAPRECAG